MNYAAHGEAPDEKVFTCASYFKGGHLIEGKLRDVTYTHHHHRTINMSLTDALTHLVVKGRIFENMENTED